MFNCGSQNVLKSLSFCISVNFNRNYNDCLLTMNNIFLITTVSVWCHGCNIIRNMPAVSPHIMNILTERDLSWPWSTRICIGAMFESLRMQLLQLFCSRNWTPLSLFLSQAMWSGVLPNLSTVLISKNVRNRHLIKISYIWFAIYNFIFGLFYGAYLLVASFQKNVYV